MSFTQINQDFFLGSASMVTHKDLPTGVYTLMYDPERGYFLRTSKPFKLPAKIYGHNSSHAVNILDHFENTPNRLTGALLSGTKGTGKSLTAKEICILALEREMPVIIINESYCGSAFNLFISEIQKSAVIFIDEFEKIYKEEEYRSKLLTFLDGVVTTHKLVLATINQSDNLEYLLNRPGRFYYHITYGNITTDIIKEYCDDFLLFPERFLDIKNFIKSFKIFTIDMLTALVREINKENNSIEKVAQIINLKPDIHLRDCFFRVKQLDVTRPNHEGINQTLDLSATSFHFHGETVESLLLAERQFTRIQVMGSSLDLSCPALPAALNYLLLNSGWKESSLVQAFLKAPNGYLDLSEEQQAKLVQEFKNRSLEFTLDFSTALTSPDGVVIDRENQEITFKTEYITFKLAYTKPTHSLSASTLFL